MGGKRKKNMKITVYSPTQAKLGRGEKRKKKKKKISVSSPTQAKLGRGEKNPKKKDLK